MDFFSNIIIQISEKKIFTCKLNKMTQINLKFPQIKNFINILNNKMIYSQIENQIIIILKFKLVNFINKRRNIALILKFKEEMLFLK